MVPRLFARHVSPRPPGAGIAAPGRAGAALLEAVETAACWTEYQIQVKCPGHGIPPIPENFPKISVDDPARLSGRGVVYPLLQSAAGAALSRLYHARAEPCVSRVAHAVLAHLARAGTDPNLHRIPEV